MRFVLSSGATLTAVLVESSRYELLVRPEVGRTAVLMKAHVVTAEEVEP